MKQKNILVKTTLPLLICTVFFSCVSMSLCAQEGKVCICVLDFVNPDIVGQRKFLNFENRQIQIGQDCTLNNDDRLRMNSVMQGYVRMIDAQSIAAGNAVKRSLQLENDRLEKMKVYDLYQTVVKGEARPLLLGADYLTAALGKHPDVFTCMDGMIALKAMDKLQHEPDFPKDFMLRLARTTGITHLVYGTIADIHSKLRTYKGYGITTKTVLYELDVFIKVADLAAQKIIYSKKYTGTLVERDLATGGIELDGNKYQTLMQSALEQAGEDLYARFVPGKADSFKATPIQPKDKSAIPAVPQRKNPEKTVSQKKQSPVQTTNSGLTPVRQNETVIIQQSIPYSPAAGGYPVIPAPPVPVPVASEENSTVVITTGGVPVVPVQRINGK